MRMWLGVKPSEMCDKHLRGEHGELHKLMGSMWCANDNGHPRKRQHENSIRGLLREGFLDLRLVRQRHDLLTSEAAMRGRSWDSPLLTSPVKRWSYELIRHNGHDNERDRNDLRARCPECAARMEVSDERTTDPVSRRASTGDPRGAADGAPGAGEAERSVGAAS